MPFHRYVALGDSFTEGVGDPAPGRPNGLRGWADRVAEVLATQPGAEGFGYANLAIRGRKLEPIIADQIEPAIALAPDLVSIHAGANDVLRPRVDLDALAATYDDGVSRLAGTGARVVLFTIFDPGSSGIYAALRGRMAIFNEHVREISDRHGTTLVDMWRMRDGDHAEVFDTDRMHLNAYGHQYIAFAVLEALGVAHDVAQLPRPTLPSLSRRERLESNAAWTRDFLGPWIHRRLTGRSSGDSVSVKRPTLAPITPSES
ncbi:SGNH/GDSL hydrolase family protein [Nocardioides marmoriginsengisoli]|uniref:SGNH/GDSL hydrolase family protein n=1 Tax=Nocardioides marmoriginsengisoli TaxID=661483 RepID=A0A3N0CAK3_9ACTN|nr:SGNH/GDSL hydrolase family protein [Nocardioides marmoriginsengisoli]RNL60494.1 SGNH/GDSL hydrolase family protein [Nocardioides marmoriginsengisoli]